MFGFRCSYAKVKCRCLYYFNFSDWCFGSWLEWDFGPVLHGSFNQGFAYGMQSLACFLPWDSRWDAFWWKLGYFGSFETTQIFLWVSKMVNSQDSVKNIRILQFDEFFSSFDFSENLRGFFYPFQFDRIFHDLISQNFQTLQVIVSFSRLFQFDGKSRQNTYIHVM